MTDGINVESSLYIEAARLIESSKLAVFFTGAGISTPSGIPDFRSNHGLWYRDNPMEVASLSVFQKHPERFYDWFYPLVKAIIDSEPNLAHKAISDLEKHRPGVRIVTQNIDRFHSIAGSTNVIELHGSIDKAFCQPCGKYVSGEQYLPDFLMTKELPRCRDCNGVIKPGIILFEEGLPQDNWGNADNLMKQCDLIIVVGSSLEVYPASSLPMTALEHGSKLIIVNDSPTQLDHYAQYIIREDIIRSVPGIIECIKK